MATRSQASTEFYVGKSWVTQIDQIVPVQVEGERVARCNVDLKELKS